MELSEDVAAAHLPISTGSEAAAAAEAAVETVEEAADAAEAYGTAAAAEDSVADVSLSAVAEQQCQGENGEEEKDSEEGGERGGEGVGIDAPSCASPLAACSTKACEESPTVLTRGGEIPVVFEERHTPMAAAGTLDLRKTIAGYLFKRELSDVVVKVPIRAPGSGELISYRAFCCHKFVLAARSQVLARLLYDFTLVEEKAEEIASVDAARSASICSADSSRDAVGSLELTLPNSEPSTEQSSGDALTSAQECTEGVKSEPENEEKKEETKNEREEREEKKEEREEKREEKAADLTIPLIENVKNEAMEEDPQEQEEAPAKEKRMVSIPSSPIVGKDALILEESSLNAVRSMLEWIYTERTSGLEEHCMEVLRIAKKYEVQELVDACHKQFMSGINEYTVCDMLVNFSAEKGSSDEEDDAVRDSIVKYLLDYAQQYAHLVLENQEFASLGEDLVTTILQQDSLNCEEEQVFNAVDRWTCKHCDDLGLEKTPEHKRMVGANLIGLVRFPNLDPKQIATKVRESGLLSGEQLVELFSYVTLKKGELSFCKSEPRTARDITFLSSNAVRLPCNGEFTGGVMEYIATAGGKEEYKNPMLRKEVDVRPSSWMPDADEQHYVVGKEVKRCVTLALANQSIVIELLGWKVCPTAYLLRHYSSWDTEALRSWTLHGSRDGHTWYLLSSHIKDETLNTKGQYHIWRFPEETVEFFSHFKIQQTGSNSNSHEYLACSGFELWGTLLKVADKTSSAE